MSGRRLLLLQLAFRPHLRNLETSAADFGFVLWGLGLGLLVLGLLVKKATPRSDP